MKYGTKAKKRPSVSCDPSIGRVVGNAMAGRHHGCHGGILFNNPPIKKRDWGGEKKERTKNQGQGPARGKKPNKMKMRKTFCENKPRGKGVENICFFTS